MANIYALDIDEEVETGPIKVRGLKPNPPVTMADLSPEDRARQLRFAEKLKALRGKVHLDVDIDELRGRR